MDQDKGFLLAFQGDKKELQKLQIEKLIFQLGHGKSIFAGKVQSLSPGRRPYCYLQLPTGR